jgi:hypothetical protein
MKLKNLQFLEIPGTFSDGFLTRDFILPYRVSESKKFFIG